jgi:type IV secretion system protein VirB2
MIHLPFLAVLSGLRGEVGTSGISLADPVGSSSIAAAVQWIEATLLGTLANTVAVIAVAGIGFMALSGRVSLRRALTVVSGCFILFGASTIAAGIEKVARDEGTIEAPMRSAASQASSPLAEPRRPPDYDPYAGAAVPLR